VEESKLQWASSLVLGVLVVFGEGVAIYAEQPLGFSPLLSRLRAIHIGIALIAILLLLGFRKKESVLLTLSTYLSIFLPSYLISTLSHLEARNLNLLWAPFTGQKLFFLGLSILVPGPYWINVVLMLGFALQATLLWTISDSLTQFSFFAVSGEPWVTVIYAGVAAVLLAYRRHYRDTVKRLALVQAKCEVFETIALVFLSVRDLANTPLQCLEISVELLRRDPSSTEKVTKEIREGVSRLGSLNRIFKIYEQSISWSKQDLLSEEAILKCLKDLEVKIGA
jgi:hypothetical protein